MSGAWTPWSIAAEDLLPYSSDAYTRQGSEWFSEYYRHTKPSGRCASNLLEVRHSALEQPSLSHKPVK